MESIPIDTYGGPQVVLELIYRLKVRDVMTADVVSAHPSATLRQVQTIMRDRGFTGVPILENGRLVGIVSIGDIIEALDGGWIEERAAAHMTESVIVLEADMPIHFAITYLNRYGFRRFPVLEMDGSLVGIVTSADIIRALLVEMNREVERLEAGLATRQARNATSPGSTAGPAGTVGQGSVTSQGSTAGRDSVVGQGGKTGQDSVTGPCGMAPSSRSSVSTDFSGQGSMVGSAPTVKAGVDSAGPKVAADPPMADALLEMDFPSRKFDFERAGKASGELKKALKRLAVDPGIIRRAAVASYELEMNQVIHSDGGRMAFSLGNGVISIVASDTGPGIPDVEVALAEGYSTANEWIRSLGFGAGLGLPNARRSADEFSIQSGPDGTIVRIVIRY
jgi:CBS domain-containing protein/anti-sigma regulatory factor (Ser/Thr protein kinase)